ncbi:PH domain-containing protein [Salipaludibacillus sp. LMS25]|jgi:hypothetical protein|uniref:PH domain-containing protein n=1 Tax=Salipaludibacillus sp. LMS25 TaxID=2924031 RepID=UPI0020D1896C|nr:PH domain-containing protein [Salipaludibacillus sp. LMS25]UTR16128.1 PH domain-containing protein [Salipaludibacillus sp. LMS25]
MVNEKHSFKAVSRKKQSKRYHKQHVFMTRFERIFALGVFGTFIFLISHPQYTVLDFPIVFVWLFFLILFSTSWNWSFYLGWNQRFDGRMRYVLEGEGLAIYFNNKKLKLFPYRDMQRVGKLRDPLTNMKNVQLFGRKYWVTPRLSSGTSQEYPTLFVFSTTIDEGILIHMAYETLLISPEDANLFEERLQLKISESSDSGTSMKNYRTFS